MLQQSNEQKIKDLRMCAISKVQANNVFSKQKKSAIITNINTNTDNRTLFSTAVDIGQAVGNGLEALFTFSPLYMFDSDTITYDRRKNTRRLSIPKKLNGSSKWDTYTDGVFENVMFTVPTHKDDYRINATSLFKRQFNMNIFDMGSIESLALMKLTEGASSLLDGIKRTQRWQAFRSLVDAKIDFSEINSDFTGVADFERDPNLTIAIAVSWTDPAADIIGDIMASSQKMNEVGLALPDTCVLSANMANAFLQNTAIKSLLDNRRIQIGDVIPQSISATNGLFYICTLFINGKNISFYGTNDIYLDPITNINKPYMEDDTALLFDSMSVDLRAYFGGISQFKLNGNNADISLSLGGDKLTGSINLPIVTSSARAYLSSRMDPAKENIILMVTTSPFMANCNANATAKIITKP